jgi:hypothetical protein
VTSAPQGSSAIAAAAIKVTDVKLWNSASPTMYTVAVEITLAGLVIDRKNITTGFRSMHYDSTNGFALNQEHFKVSGSQLRMVGWGFASVLHLIGYLVHCAYLVHCLHCAYMLLSLHCAYLGQCDYLVHWCNVLIWCTALIWCIVQVRGFCDHTNFAVVGMAIPPRINLFRAQASRAVGGNGRRTSHNPPDPRLLDIYDRVGVVVMDENRLFDNNSAYVNNMGALVKRDRNHPAVVIWVMLPRHSTCIFPTMCCILPTMCC